MRRGSGSDMCQVESILWKMQMLHPAWHTTFAKQQTLNLKTWHRRRYLLEIAFVPVYKMPCEKRAKSSERKVSSYAAEAPLTVPCLINDRWHHSGTQALKNPEMHSFPLYFCFPPDLQSAVIMPIPAQSSCCWHADSQWDDFLTRKKRELVGLSSIVDDRGRMLGCTYNYTDVDNADLESAMSRAIATAAASKAAAEDDHAAAIFGGSATKHSASEPGTDAPHRPESRHQHGRARSPRHSHGHERRDRDRVDRDRDRHGRSRHSSRHHDAAEPDRRRQRAGHAQGDHTWNGRYAERQESRKQRDGCQEEVRRERSRAGGDSRSRRSEHQLHDDEHVRDRSCRHVSSAAGGREHRGEAEDRYRRRSSGVDAGRTRGQDVRAGGREHTEHRQHGPTGHGGMRSQERMGHASERGLAQAEGACGRTEGDGRDATGQNACDRGVQQQGLGVEVSIGDAPGCTFGGTTCAGNHGFADRPAGSQGGDSGGLPSLKAIVPEGAMVVETEEIVGSVREVAEHDALDASAVLKARGSWREQLKRRKEGLL